VSRLQHLRSVQGALEYRGLLQADQADAAPDFLGHSRKAIEWQVWTALLMYVLLRFLHTCSDWRHSFTRLFTCLRAVLWQRRHSPRNRSGCPETQGISAPVCPQSPLMGCY
jgi:hypothetical protein